jgi:hypothetical protein
MPALAVFLFLILVPLLVAATGSTDPQEYERFGRGSRRRTKYFNQLARYRQQLIRFTKITISA